MTPCFVLVLQWGWTWASYVPSLWEMGPYGKSIRRPRQLILLQKSWMRDTASSSSALLAA